MGKVDQEWEIAQSLLRACATPEDVEQLIVQLRDTHWTRRICSLLQPFAGSHEKSLSMGEGSRVSATAKSESRMPKSSAEHTSKADLEWVKEVEDLFRAAGMTNSQVETWFQERFAIERKIAKSSLHDYLIHIIDDLNYPSSEFLTSFVRLNFAKDRNRHSDLTEYLEQLARRRVSS